MKTDYKKIAWSAIVGVAVLTSQDIATAQTISTETPTTHNVAIQEYGFWGDVGKGAATGAAGGCAAGALAGGVGCGPGAVAGGVAGGVSGAAGWAWDKVFD